MGLYTYRADDTGELTLWELEQPFLVLEETPLGLQPQPSVNDSLELGQTVQVFRRWRLVDPQGFADRWEAADYRPPIGGRRTRGWGSGCVPTPSPPSTGRIMSPRGTS